MVLFIPWRRRAPTTRTRPPSRATRGVVVPFWRNAGCGATMAPALDGRRRWRSELRGGSVRQHPRSRLAQPRDTGHFDLLAQRRSDRTSRGKTRSSRGNIRGNRGRVNLLSAIFRAREKRGHLRRDRPPFPFCDIPFCRIAVGAIAGGCGARAIGGTLLRSAARSPQRWRGAR